MAVWDAEVSVDAAVVRRLLAQFPELALDSVEQFSEGWDRSLWLIDGVWVFGFPRRAVAVPGIERELEFLPRLAPLVPVPIPVPLFAGAPADEFPWPFSGSRLLPGEEASERAVHERRAISLELARFLRSLHGSAVQRAVGAERLPLDANERADLSKRLPRARTILAELDPRDVPTAAAQILDEAEGLPAPREATVVHGDLHARQILVDGAHVTGVVDWVDFGRADPAIDLQLLWSFVDPPGRADFLAAYGPVADDQLLRARVTAVWLPAIVALSARELGMSVVARDALHALERACTD